MPDSFQSPSDGCTAPGNRLAVTESARRIVRECGFDRVGFATAGQSRQADRFRDWLARGFAADMGYLARNAERRCDPREVVHGARSVIVTALHYHPPEHPPGTSGQPTSSQISAELSEDRSARALLSCYAGGTDYHRVVEGRLRRARDELRATHPDHEFRFYVDTGPVLERYWAQESGVGWIGKNTCSIDAARGSYFFIGSIITTLELEPDSPATDHCGSCRLCLDACPTDAFVGPYQLDSRRCISYLNIENRGGIDAELREAMGTWVFGCDVCQEVCPYNRPTRDPIPPDPELVPRKENRSPQLSELASVDSVEKFRARFPRSAVRRAGFAGFVRNLAVALGNSGQRDLLPQLERLAQSAVGREPAVRDALDWARDRLSGRPSVPGASPKENRADGRATARFRTDPGDPEGI